MCSAHDLLEQDIESERPIFLLASKAVVYIGGGGYEAINLARLNRPSGALSLAVCRGEPASYVKR